MKISILHPTRSRPNQASATAKAWLSSAKCPELIEYIFSIDEDEPYGREYVLIDMPFMSTNTMTINPNKSAIEAINKASEISTGDLIIVVSDDFNTPPFHWDEALRTALAGREDYLVKTQDGAQPWIITLPIMDRSYYNRFGYVYHPAYMHLFCDTEMSHVGEMLGRLIKLPIKFPHNHYTTGKTPKDDINKKNDATWSQGEETYLKRLMDNFGLEDSEIDQTYLSRIHKSHLQWLRSKGIEYAGV